MFYILSYIPQAGLNVLKQCAAIPEGFLHPLVSCILSLNYGFFEFFYCLGEPDIKCISDIQGYYAKTAPKSIAVIFGAAFLAQQRGEFDLAVQYYTEYTHAQTIMKSFHNISYWQKIWIYA